MRLFLRKYKKNINLYYIIKNIIENSNNELLYSVRYRKVYKTI